MALINCPNCGKEISNRAQSCPACGYKLQTHIAINANSNNSTIVFGNYYQENSNVKHPIEWIVLENSDDKVLLLSKKVLDAQPYNTNLVDVTWETCSLRKWLNNDFFNVAFSDIEKEYVKSTTISTKDNLHPLRMIMPAWLQSTGGNIHPPIISGGKETLDKVFLLSWEDAAKYFRRHPNSDMLVNQFRGMLSMYQSNDVHNIAAAYSDIRAYPTEYAISKNVYIPNSEHGAWWWFRSPGNTSQMAVGTMNGDILYRVGCEVNDATYGIRPAIWVDKEAFMSPEEKAEKWKARGLCQHCGGMFSGLITKRCTVCGTKKDY